MINFLINEIILLIHKIRKHHLVERHGFPMYSIYCQECDKDIVTIC